MEPKVSFIVPIYNKEKNIEECLLSIMAQTVEDIEILCVDNNSSDASMSVVEKLSASDPRIKILHEKEQGLPQARNCALMHAAGEYIAFVDADDYVDKRLAELAVASAEENGSDVVLYTFKDNKLESDRFEKVWARRLPKEQVKAIDLGDDLCFYFSPSVWSKLFRRSFLEEINLTFDPGLKQAEDVLFSYCAIISAQSISQVYDPPLYNYRRNAEGSMIADRANVEQSLAVLLAYEKLDDWLLETGNATKFEGAFLRKLLSEINYTFELTSDSCAFSEYFDFFRAKYRKRFRNLAVDQLSDSPLYRIYIESESFGEAMFEKSKELLARTAVEKKKNEANLSKEKRNLKIARDESSKIKASYAYRLSRILRALKPGA